jgi:putative membrane protein
MHLLLALLLNAFLVYTSGALLSGVLIESYWVAILVALVMGLINWTIKPLITLITLPVTILTFGLFLLVINGAMVLLASAIVPGFEVVNFWWALLFLLILSLFNYLLDSLTGQKAPEKS